MRPILLLSILFSAITFTSSAQTASLSGRILAPTGDSAFVLYNHVVAGRMKTDKLAAAKLDNKGQFSMKLAIDSARFLTFFDGSEQSGFFLMPGEALQVGLHTAYFDETLTYTGQGAERNNALAAIAMADEMNWIPVYAQWENPDTATLYPQIEEFTKKMSAMLSDYALEYPEMTAHLADMIAEKEQNAEQTKDQFRETIQFKKRAEALVGKPIADIAGVDLEGKKLSLSQFKGKTTVVDFWATWCGPCKAEMPYWAKLQAQYGKDINFVSIGVWCKEDGWKTMAKELGLAHNIYVAKEGEAALAPYEVNSIPRYMVIDKNGNIVTIDAPRPSSPNLVKFF